jgi:hypothetical protein
LKKTLKTLNFSVEKESQWTNVDDYHPLWMIIVQSNPIIHMIDIVRDRKLGARWYYSKIHVPQMIYSSKADDISSMSAVHHPHWLSSSLVDYRPHHPPSWMNIVTLGRKSAAVDEYRSNQMNIVDIVEYQQQMNIFQHSR